MPLEAEQHLKSSSRPSADPPDIRGHLNAIVLPMPRVTADGQPIHDHAAGGRLGPARGVIIGLAAGAALWAGLLSLARHLF